MNHNWDQLPLILTPRDVQRIFPGGKNRVYSLFNRPDFPAIRDGKRFFVSKDSFRRWLEEQAGGRDGR